MQKPDLSKVSAEELQKLREHYRATLFDDVAPWWLQHSLDRECGGYFSCLERDGRPWATDKFLWMTGREIWMFSRLYNQYEQKPEWLEASHLGAEFTLKHAFLPEGKMYFRLTRDGRPMSKALSLFSEMFVSIGLAELSKASGEEHYWDRAMKMYEFLMPRFGLPSDTALLSYPIETHFHLHSHDMCRLTVAWVFNEICPNQRFVDDFNLSADSIVNRHWKPELNALLENVAMDGSPMLDLPEGRMFHPGHSIEIAWMLLEVAQHRNDSKLLDTAVDIIFAALKQGWDKEFGGIRYLTNIDWSPTHELGANLKLWWVHCETLYALLLAWSLTGREDLWNWYQKVHDYTFSHFPDPEYGEWFGYLDRDGRPVWTAKATAWKCFFHLPRMLFRCYQLLSRILNHEPQIGKSDCSVCRSGT
jgi:N-acylglucosamine 2-epimerase